MADLPSRRQRRTVKVVIYMEPQDANDLTSLAQANGMSVSELGRETLIAMIDEHLLEGEADAEPLPPR